MEHSVPSVIARVHDARALAEGATRAYPEDTLCPGFVSAALRMLDDVEVLLGADAIVPALVAARRAADLMSDAARSSDDRPAKITLEGARILALAAASGIASLSDA